MYRDYVDSAVGPIEILCDEEFLLSVSFVKKANKTIAPNKLTKLTAKQLNEYFEGKRKKFDIPLKVEGTEFQKKVCKKLEKISVGQLETYASVDKSLGKPRGSCAVGEANTKNKIGFMITCHQVAGTCCVLGYAPDLEYKEFFMKL